MASVTSELPWFLRERVRVVCAQAVIEDRTLEASAARLAQLDADGELSPYGLRMRAALALHDGDPAAALGFLDRSIERRRGEEDRHDLDVDRLMRAEVLNELGDHGAALVEVAALIDEDGTGRARLHARAVARERRG